MFVVLIGAPGSGKGTQAKALSTTTGLTHVASGDLFRDAVQKGTELGRAAKGYMEGGELVPDSLTVPMIIERLEQPDARYGVILDGFPRTLQQAVSLDQAFAERQLGIDRVLYLSVPSEYLIQRLSGRWICRDCHASFHEVNNPPARPGVCDHCGGELYQRNDDRRETVEHRLSLYFDMTLPLIEYYRRRSILVEVNGAQAIDRVGSELLGALRQDGD